MISILYRDYEINYEAGFRDNPTAGCVTVLGVRDFNPVHTFECGQCFRWYKEHDGSYTGVVRGKAANVSYIPDTQGTSNTSGSLVLNNVTLDDFKQIWFDYFDLGTDYALIKRAVSIDSTMKKAVEFGSGIRLLRQEPWETLISFILSSNNRIPRIMKIVGEISRLFGEGFEAFGKEYFSFPQAQALADCCLEQIQECRAGYRCGYIHETAKAVAEMGYDLEELAEMGTEEARNALMRFKGVGNKVADCVLLYSGIKRDVFPTDVWVKRVMEELYIKTEASFKQIQEFAAENFGEYAGAAQQYLFYFAREHKIGA